MSNSKSSFFLFLLFGGWLSLLFPQQISADAARKQELRAEVFFEKNMHEKAIEAYNSLFEAGYYSEQSLYRMAFLHEQKENWIEAIFFLKKIQIAYGGQELSFRLKYLADKLGARFPLDSAGPGLFEMNFYRNLLPLLGACLGLLAAGLLLVFFARRAWLGAVGLTGLAFSLLIAGGILAGHYGLPERAMLIQETPFHARAAYASTQLNVPLEPGQSVEVIARNDIWCKIRQGAYKAWVPYFSLRLLNE